ncbi:hypothetical protein KFK09_004724 [Dendrobium nobile]|uniref:Uncharacterized protein n=1 Tax=Dendrobium nobile TaxID=94219 RepID=A0A8T3BZB0_DENNO|nr:hypothetical protein KFK09_004724 [Dendrobium nobile]
MHRSPHLSLDRVRSPRRTALPLPHTLSPPLPSSFQFARSPVRIPLVIDPVTSPCLRGQQSKPKDPYFSLPLKASATFSSLSNLFSSSFASPSTTSFLHFLLLHCER